jgi:Ig-like domain-containing protein
MASAKHLFFFLLIIALAQAACGLPREPTALPPTLNLPVTFTIVAQTRAALALTPSETSIPKSAPSQTPTLIPTPTATPICDSITFVADMTIPDGTPLKPNEKFTKTWRLRNGGACTWTTAYNLVFERGDKLGAQDAYPLQGNIPPGETVDLSINMVAGANGSYESFWMLRNAAGQKFGLGGSTNRPFWVKIQVALPGTFVVYDFAANVCKALWTGGDASSGVLLNCPGTQNDSQGFIIPLQNQRLEDGSTSQDVPLLTGPRWVDNGIISGKYPPFLVQQSDRFKTRLGCLYESVTSCNVRFQLNYFITGSNEIHNLKEYDQVYDGIIEDVDIDLKDLADKSVEFVFTTIANGSPSNGFAFWFAPRIVH